MSDVFRIFEFACKFAIKKLEDAGCNDSQMRDFAELLAVRASVSYLHLSLKYSGEQFYIPKNPLNRAQKIQNAFKGNNIDELAAQFNVHRATVYRALKQEKKDPTPDFLGEIIDCLLDTEIDKSEIEKNSALFLSIYKRFVESDVFSRFMQN